MRALAANLGSEEGEDRKGSTKDSTKTQNLFMNASMLRTCQDLGRSGPLGTTYPAFPLRFSTFSFSSLSSPAWTT